MKTTHRSIPNDIFSVEESGASIRILSNHRLIHVYTTSHDGSEFSGVYSFQDFLNALQALLIGIPLSPPSQPNKEATAPAVDTKQAAPEFASHAVGDRVEVIGPGCQQGVIIGIDPSGYATCKSEWGMLFFHDLCALKNLSRQEKP